MFKPKLLIVIEFTPLETIALFYIRTEERPPDFV
jgi:hypothetical protein